MIKMEFFNETKIRWILWFTILHWFATDGVHSWQPCSVQPRLIMKSVQESGRFELNKEKNEAYVTKEIKLRLECKAAVPVELKFQGYLVATNRFFINCFLFFSQKLVSEK